MRSLIAVLVAAVLVLTVSSCSDNAPDSIIFPKIGHQYSVVFTEAPDVTTTPDFRSVTFDRYVNWIQITVDLWEPHDPSNYPTDYVLTAYLYGTHRDLINVGLHNFEIRRDPGNDGYFEEVLADGAVVWVDNKTACFSYHQTVMPDFETKEVWLYSMASEDRMPDTDRVNIADSLPQD